MKYPKMTPFEALVVVNSSVMRSGGLVNMANGNDLRFPASNGQSFDSNQWNHVFALADNSGAIVISDGQSAANKIRKLNFATGVFTPFAQGPSGNLRGCDISPNKTKLAIASSNTEPFVEFFDVPSMLKELSQLATGSLPGGCFGVKFNKGGTKLAAAVYNSPYGLGIINVATKTVERVLSIEGAGTVCDWSYDGAWVACGLNVGTQRIQLFDTATWTKQTLSSNVGVGFNGCDISFNPTNQFLVCAGNGTETTSLSIVRLSDKRVLPIVLASGHRFSSTSRIAWVSEYECFFIANSSANSVVGYLLNVATRSIQYSYIELNAFVGWPNFGSGFVLRRLAGTVVDGSDTPVSRVVKAYHRESGIQCGETTSSDVDGTFEMNVFTSEPLFVMSVGQGSEISKLFDSVNPAPPVPVDYLFTNYATPISAGDRQTSITPSLTGMTTGGGTLNGLIDGNTGTNNWYWNAATGDGSGFIRFDFGSGSNWIIDGFTWYQSNSTSHGIWKFEGSNDASSWTQIGEDFTLGGSSTSIYEWHNETPYRYYRLRHISGSRSTSPFSREIEFQAIAAS